MAEKKKHISAAERRHQDYLRRKGLKVGAVYEARLLKLRSQEVKRVLALCQDYRPESWRTVIERELSEPYYEAWLTGLVTSAGVPQAQSVVRDLNKPKAAGSSQWVSVLRDYAIRRVGESIVSVTGTFRDTLIGILTDEFLDTMVGEGIEAMTKRIYRSFRELEKWQCRRIAQTETMIALGEAAAAAADTLEVPFTKTWCTSGLSNTRDSHLLLDGVTVDQDEYFTVGESLSRMLYPHDTSSDPAAEEIINCACACIRSPK